MKRRAGSLLVLILGIAMIPCSQADVLNFARDWTQREEQTPPANTTPTPQKKQARPVTTAPAKTAAPRQPQKKPSPAPKATVKKKTTEPVVKAPASPPKSDGASGRDNTPPAGRRDPKVTLPDAQLLGAWIKTLARHASLSPRDAELRERYRALQSEVRGLNEQLSASREEQQRQLQSALEQLAGAKEKLIVLEGREQHSVKETQVEKQEIQTLKTRIERQEEKEKQWQLLTRKLQQSLKEAQYPALPATEAGMADFAAGMAMGLDITDFLERREEQGSASIKRPS